jgi:hypothetical protein
MVVHACNPSTVEAEMGGLKVGGQLEWHSEICLKKNQPTNQPTNQQTNQSTNQPTNHLTNQQTSQTKQTKVINAITTSKNVMG